MEYLADIALLIRRTVDGESGAYSFEVLNCDKWKYLDGKQADGSVKLNGKTLTRGPRVPSP